MLLYPVNYLERVDIGFAAPKGMNAELGPLFSVAAGVFSVVVPGGAAGQGHRVVHGRDPDLDGGGRGRLDDDHPEGRRAVRPEIAWTRGVASPIVRVGVPVLAGGLAIPVAPYLSDPLLVMDAGTLCACGVLAALHGFWSLPTV